MVDRAPIFSALWIFVIGIVPSGGCGPPEDGAEDSPAPLLENRVAAENHASSGKSASTGHLPVASALASGSPTSPGTPNLRSGPQSQAQGTLEAAVRMLESHSCVSAKIFLEGHLFDKHLVGQGVYLQQRSGRQLLMRLELRMQHGEQTSSLVQVCDGQTLWERRNLLGDEKRSHIDVARAARGLERDEEPASQGEVGFLPGLGGLPRLLRGLDAACDFTSAQEGLLKVGNYQIPVWKLHGQWKSDQLLKLLGKPEQGAQPGSPPDLKKLPPHVFDHVILMLGQEDLFPYRIEYRRTVAGKALRSDTPPSRPLMTTQLHDVVLDAPVDPSRFRYNPGQLDYPERTVGFLHSLGIKR